MAKQHVMIDIETMGLKHNAAIISIGAVHFNQHDILKEFYTNVSLSDCLLHGLTQDQSTIDWWMKQSVEARSAWQRDDANNLTEALILFTNFLRSVGSEKDICPWGNGSDFDLVIMTNAHRAIDVDPYWKYYNHHCFRTLKNLFPVAEAPRKGTYHNALDDAITQVDQLHRILKVHELTLP